LEYFGAYHFMCKKCIGREVLGKNKIKMCNNVVYSISQVMVQVCVPFVFL
jgi:hypothetical protein